MTDKQTIFLTWLVIFAVTFMSMVAVQGHVQDNSESIDPVVFNGEYITVNYTHHRGINFDGNDDYVRIDMDTGIAEYHESEKSTYDILNNHNFYNWSDYDKELLTQMMQVTAASALGIETELSFEELASTAPVHVLVTYIDLLESAGY